MSEVLAPMERELAARSALLAARMFEMHGWSYAGFFDERYVPSVEKIAETIEHLIKNGGGSTGRFHVYDKDGFTEVYLLLGTIVRDEDGSPYSLSVGDAVVPSPNAARPAGDGGKQTKP